MRAASPHLRRLLAASAAVCVSAGLAAGSAWADGTDPAYPGSTLHVSVSGRPQAGRVLTITATGSNTADDLSVHGDYDLQVIAVDPSRLPGPCDRSFADELNAITDNPGGVPLTLNPPSEGPSGPFRIPLRYTPSGSGPLLVCAYSQYITGDAAQASTRVQIAPAAVRPRNIARPRITRSHDTLTCRRGTWSGSPTSYSYRWRIGAGALSHARHSATDHITGRARGHRVSCSVTARNARGFATATSRALQIRL